MFNGYRTYISIIVALVPTFAGFFGFHVTEAFAGQFSAQADSFIELAGLIAAAYFRAKAEAPGWLVKNPQ